MSRFLDILRSYQAYGLIAFVVTVFATPVAARVAHRLGVMDVPDLTLKPHARPTPYLGGTAICLGWTVPLVVAMARRTVDWRLLLPVMLGGIAISLVGLLDDVRSISPKLRLALGTLITAAVLLSTGIGSELVDTLLQPVGIHAPSVVVVPVSFIIAVFIVLGACNSANLIDGLDGLCTGVTGIISLGFFLLATHLAVWQYSGSGDPVRLVLAIAMFGAAMGFLPLNFNPAKIFMGDAGSTLLGFNCGIMIVLFAEQGIFRWFLGGLMVFALPITDTALAVVRRWRSGRSIFAGDRSHFYDQLVDRGLSVKRVVIISYSLAAFYALVGCVSIWLRTRYMLPLCVLVGAATLTVIAVAGMMRAEPPPGSDS
ncbi:MAG TPA: MraY family glycosyltransferase [Phycisphaerae bacterium]|nr:MraY family glycosyltransferase [Phycisphaerae bacterium]